MAVPYAYEYPYDRAPHYYAITCASCHEFNDLRMKGGKLLCAWHRGETKIGRFLNPHLIPADDPAWIEDATT